MSGPRLYSDCLVGIDSAATPDYIGAASSDGVMRTDSTISYTDGGNYVTLAVNQAYAYTWTGAHTWGSSGSGVDLTAYSAVSGDNLLWDANGATGGGGKLTIDGNAQLSVDGKSTFGTGTMGGTYGYTLISAGTTINPNIGESAACIEFSANMATTGSFNGVYGFQLATTTSDTVTSAILAYGFDSTVNLNHSSGTLSSGAAYTGNITKSNAGTVTRASCFRAEAPTVNAGTLTTYHAFYLGANPTAATNNWAIWLKGGKSRFGDDNTQTHWGTADDAYFTYDGSNFICSVAAITSASSFVVKDAGIIVNEDGGDKDTRIEGDTQTHCFFLDASADNIGICDSTPLVRLDINGGLALASSGSATSLTADNQAVTVGNVSHIILSSNDATATNRTFTLSNGLTDGHLLTLEWSGTNAGEIVAATNIKLSATWTPTQYDTLSLMWSTNASAWLEKSRSANA